MGHDWLVQAWKCSPELRQGERPLVLGMRDGEGRWQALLPLRHNLKTRRLSFLEENFSQRLDLLAAPGVEAWAPLAAHLRRRRDWDRLDLQMLRPESAAAARRAFAAQGMGTGRRGGVRQRRVRLAAPWEAIEAGFSPYLRANFRRRLKRLEKLGRLRLEEQAGEAQLEAALGHCFALEGKGWKGAKGTAILDDRPRQRFYRQLAHRLARAGRLRLYLLWLEERLIAFEYCIGDGGSGRLYSLKIAYDEEFRTMSPGTVLRWLLLQRVQGEFGSYEFLGDDAAWKSEWTAEVVELEHVRVYNRTWRGRGWRWGTAAKGMWRGATSH